jgi:hypothetical protein
VAAVEGFDPAKSGQQPVDGSGNVVPVGVWGDTTVGVGVFGSAGLLVPGESDVVSDPAGVEGHGLAVPGVLGRSLQDAGVTGESLESSGVLGRGQSGSGVLGVTFGASGSGAAGVFGSSTTGGDGVVGFVGDGTGVVGDSVRGDGVVGISGSGNGVVGENFSQPGDPMDPRPAGVVGRSDLGDGVSGSSTQGSGVAGLNLGAGAGVWGSNCANDPGIGVKGTSLAGTGVAATSLIGDGVTADSIVGNGVTGFSSRAAGVLGESGPDGFAGLFLGRVRVTGALLKGGGGFEIDHPLDPENKYLRHSFVESPQMLNVYSGNVVTDERGEAAVMLPDYFDALNDECRYQLTVIGNFAQAVIAREVQDNRFLIRTDKPRVAVSWQVTAVRRDPWAQANRIDVESEKAPDERGLFLHPEARHLSDSLRLRQPATHDARPARGVDAELRRTRALLPPELDEQVERAHQGVVSGEPIDQDALRALIATCLRGADVSTAHQRTTREVLERAWDQLDETLQAVNQKRPWPSRTAVEDTRG